MEASRAGAGAAERGNGGGGIKIPNVTSATGVTTAPWEGDRGVDSVGLRTRTPFVVRYLDAAVLSRATRHGRCEEGGGDRGRAGSVPTWRIRVRGDQARFGREMRQGSPREAGGTHRTSVGTAPTSIARAAYRDRSRGRALEPVATSYSPARLANAGLIGGPGRKSNCCHTEQIEVKILHAQRMKISDDQRQEIWYGRKVLLMHVAAPMPRRRLQTPRIDVKLRHDLAETSLCILGMQQKGILCHVDLPPLRVELRTSGLQDRRSNQLSYKGRVSLDPAFRGRYATQSMAYFSDF